jgi:hypothetical protein
LRVLYVFIDQLRAKDEKLYNHGISYIVMGKELRSDICRLQDILTVDVLLRKCNFVFCVWHSKTLLDGTVAVYRIQSHYKFSKSISLLYASSIKCGLIPGTDIAGAMTLTRRLKVWID